MSNENPLHFLFHPEEMRDLTTEEEKVYEESVSKLFTTDGPRWVSEEDYLKMKGEKEAYKKELLEKIKKEISGGNNEDREGLIRAREIIRSEED